MGVSISCLISFLTHFNQPHNSPQHYLLLTKHIYTVYECHKDHIKFHTILIIKILMALWCPYSSRNTKCNKNFMPYAFVKHIYKFLAACLSRVKKIIADTSFFFVWVYNCTYLIQFLSSQSLPVFVSSENVMYKKKKSVVLMVVSYILN